MGGGGRIAGGRFPRPRLPLLLLLAGLGALAWAAAPRPVVIHQEVHQEAPAQVFNAPVRVHVEQRLPEVPSVARSLQIEQADEAQRRAVRQSLLEAGGAIVHTMPPRPAER